MKSNIDLINKMNSGGKCIVGMVHCLPLPGTLNYAGDIELIYERAVQDAINLEKAGVDAIIVENTNDKPSSIKLDVEQVTMLASVTRKVVETVAIPVGVDAGFSDGIGALCAAYVSNACFIRSPVFVDSMHLTGVGLVNPCSRELIRYRKMIGAENVGIWADVQVKHSHLINENVSLEESAQIAIDSGAEVIITTGLSTGMETPIDTVKRVKAVSNVPVIVGSGFNINNLHEQFEYADGAIVGTALKLDRNTLSPIDLELASKLMNCVHKYECNHEK